jgi:ornithine--oxo-acid transaminase
MTVHTIELVSRTPTYVAREKRFGANNYRPLEVVLVRGEGIWVWDVDGKKYMDFLAAYSAVNQGHCHPKIAAALIKQAGTLTLTSRAFFNDQLGFFQQELCKLTGFEAFLPMNSGAEAVETAIKLGRKWGHTVKGIPDGEGEVVVFEENFHGRTTTIVGFSSNEQYRRGFGPFAGGFRRLPFGDATAVEATLAEHGARTAAILVEPIQGEAGIVLPPDGYLRRLRELCDRHNVLLIADEIQSGLGRTGKLFAFEHEGIRPDAVTVGKALAGGFYPLSGVLANRPLMDVLQPGDHGSTFGGNPLAAAVGRAAIKVLVEEGMIENSARLGAHLLTRLRTIAEQRADKVAEVRGRGLWAGIELRPEAGGARRYCESLRDLGVLCKETHTHTIRIAPPLVIQQGDLDAGLDLIEKVLA